jgi:hypothetical protein
MTLPETYKSQVQHIQESPKFVPAVEGGRKPVPFPGYTVITPPSEEDAANNSFYTNLQHCQEQLLQQFPSGLMVPVPPASFHVTLADLIWANAYLHAKENPQFEVQLRSQIGKIFEQTQPLVDGGNQINFQLLGIMVMPRAIAVSLVAKDESAYDRIVKFRRAIYQNGDLIGLGIEQQYGFTAHITLGYFGDIPADLDHDRLSKTISELNLQWLDNPQELLVNTAQLRKFDDMTRYYREPDWPVLDF